MGKSINGYSKVFLMRIADIFSHRFPAMVLAVFLLTVPMPRNAEAEEETAAEIMKGVLSSFSLPLRDLMEKEHPSEAKNLFSGFSGNVSFSLPLRKELPADRQGADTQGKKAGT